MGAGLGLGLWMGGRRASRDPSVVALLHFDGADGTTTFPDETGKIWTPSGGAQIDTAQSVFGGSSYYNATAGRIQTPYHADFDLGTGAFLMEWRQRRITNAGIQVMWSRGYGSPGGMAIQSNGTGTQIVYFWDSGGVARSVLSTPTLLENVWYACALQRDDVGTLRYYLDGVHSAMNGDPYTISSLSVSAPFLIGGDAALSYPHSGWIDEFRLRRGVAPYTVAGYTPTGPFTL